MSYEITVIDCPALGTVKVLALGDHGMFAMELPKGQVAELIEKLEAVR